MMRPTVPTGAVATLDDAARMAWLVAWAGSTCAPVHGMPSALARLLLPGAVQGERIHGAPLAVRVRRPLAAGPLAQASRPYVDHLLREVRGRRLQSPVAHWQQPTSRCQRSSTASEGYLPGRWVKSLAARQVAFRRSARHRP